MGTKIETPPRFHAGPRGTRWGAGIPSMPSLRKAITKRTVRRAARRATRAAVEGATVQELIRLAEDNHLSVAAEFLTRDKQDTGTPAMSGARLLEVLATPEWAIEFDSKNRDRSSSEGVAKWGETMRQLHELCDESDSDTDDEEEGALDGGANEVTRSSL